MKKKLYLSSWINFGKFRNKPDRLQDIIDTPSGLQWVLWMMKNSGLFEFDNTVLEYVNSKQNRNELLLPS